YPNRMKREAEISCHMTLERLLPDLDKIEDKEIPIYIYHLKPLYEEEIIEEIKSAGRKNITILKRGDVIEI
ncbi:MAG: 3',5'-cyclic-nucleotide phosphodiesterase, partial [Nitrospinae bacterium]|nr:3',5'-cyclic-nucleotide phosphodiesterase [Nitrospinota bacterium]